VVVSQDPATLAHLQRNLGRTEQEYLIEVAEGGPGARAVADGAAAAGIGRRQGQLAERAAPALAGRG
jgi:23S rRNA pseudouridine2604 synthase